MKPVVQEEKTGCGIASVAMLAGVTYRQARRAAHELGIEVKSMEHALDARVESQKHPSYAGKLIQTMRAMFGGHSRQTDIVS